MTRWHGACERELQARLHLALRRLRRFPAQHTGMKRSHSERRKTTDGMSNARSRHLICTAAHGRARDSKAPMHTHRLHATSSSLSSS